MRETLRLSSRASLDRSMARWNVAMSDAVNSVQARYTPLLRDRPVAPKASAEAAASAAARQMLRPASIRTERRESRGLRTALKSIPDRAERTEGYRARRADRHRALCRARENDATNVPDTYRPVDQPGVLDPTTPPLFPQYGAANPGD